MGRGRMRDRDRDRDTERETQRERKSNDTAGRTVAVSNVVVDDVHSKCRRTFWIDVEFHNAFLPRSCQAIRAAASWGKCEF